MKFSIATIILAASGPNAYAGSLLRGNTSRELSSKDNVNKGSPAEFKFGDDKSCLGFDKEEEGGKAEPVNCDDATSLVYRDDYLIELEDNSDLCLDNLVLKKCDDNEDTQKWLFIFVKRDHDDDVFRLMNRDSHDFLELDGKEFKLDDGYDEDQEFTGPDSDFFDFE
jgi:hypothetical protein